MSTQQSNSRPLAPAPPSSLDGSSDAGGSSPGAIFNTAGIKRASTACQSCKQIKRKCDQAQPCSNCRKSHTPCIYNEADDGRRKAARKRTVESLELKRDALDSILDIIRTSDDQHVQKLVQLIRAHAPIEDIMQYTTAHATSLPNNLFRNISTVVHGQPRRTVLSVTDLCDTPLVRVPSKPWTTLTDDDELVSHLMSIYFTWFHIAYPVMVKDLFISDMANGTLDCQFCSPLLVNAMLSMACHFSDHPRACKIPSDASTRGRHFLDEAVRLWTEQEGKPTLLNIQAVSILAVSTTLSGKDRLSLSYIEQLSGMQEELLFKSTQADVRGTEQTSYDMKRSQVLTTSTCFLLTVGYGSAFMKSSLAVSLTDQEPTLQPDLEQTISWLPYPQHSPELTIPFRELHQAQYSLHKIGSAIQAMNFGGRSATQEHEFTRLEEKLLHWEHSLPASLELPDDSSVIKPPIMDLHLTYYWFRTILFNFVKTPQSSPATPTEQIDPAQLHARTQVLESAKTIAELEKRFGRDFGLKQTTMWMPQTTLSAAHSIIDVLSDPARGLMAQDVFHELCLVLVAASQRWLIMKGHVRMLFVTAEEKGHRLPKRTKDLLRFVASERWGEKDHLQFASASYPNYSLAKDEDPRLAAMGDLLERWADFQFHDDAEEALVENAHNLSTHSEPSSGSESQRPPSTNERNGYESETKSVQ